MAKTKISQFDAVASNNTDINSVNVAEGCPPSGINNSIREMASLLKKQEVGTDAMTSPDIDGGTIDGATIGASSASTGAFTTISASGNVDLNGDLDVDGTTNLDNTDIDGTLNVQGETTLQTHLNMGDGDIIKLGASADLQIYHDGSDSYIKDAGTGNLTLQGTNLNLYNSALNKLYLNATDGGSVDLYHNNSKKFETTSSGVTVTGDIGATTGTISTGIQLGNGTTDGFILVEGGTNTHNDLVFQSKPSNGGAIERMRIDSSGNVGIGNTVMSSMSADARQLVVGTGSGNNGITIFSATNGTGNIYYADGSSGANRYRGWLEYAHSSDYLTFGVAGAERMRLQADGTLSIGTSNDTTAKLYVLNNNTEPVAFIQSGSNGNDGVIAINTSLNANAGNTDCQHLKSTTQNVGTFKLNGNGSSTFSSDERLKKNIETTRDGYLEDLAKLRVVKYNWHCHDDSTDKELGLIAQEVQKVFPKLIVEDDVELNGIEKPLAIKNSVLPMMLLKALQEANTKITALEARITTLEGA